jgi:FAD/FMN-containing dehydrogenase
MNTTAPPEPPSRAWEALAAGIAGEVARPGSPGFDHRHRGFNARFHAVRPQAIVYCATPQDVAEAIRFIGRHGLRHATRSGGHCFAGHSSTPGVVVDVTPMRSVSVAGDLAVVGAGARLGEVYDALGAHDLTIAGGTCPAVGIAGLTLGGGLGILGRTYGVTSDRLVAAQIVLADGRIVDCDDSHDEDLFWALRGAGAGNFGVVTSLVLRAVPAPWAANFHLRWPFPDAAAVIAAWQRWAPHGPDGLAASLKVTATGQGDRPPSVDVYGSLLETGMGAGEAREAAGLVDTLIGRVGSDPALVTSERMAYPATRRFWADLGSTDPVSGHQPPPDQPHLVAKSEFFGRRLPVEAIAGLVEMLTRDRAPGETRELDFMPWGGAYNRVPADATAFVHRDELFQLKHAAVVDSGASPAEAGAARRWVGRSWATVHPWGSGRVFQNFADPDLAGWADAYYGTNQGRLVRVKARYDAGDLFHSHQSLPVR